MGSKGLWLVFAVMALMLLGPSTLCPGISRAAVYGAGADQFSLATGSPGELGLLKVLAETFGKQDNAAMAWFKAGSGKSLQAPERQKSGPDHGPRPGRGKARRFRTAGPPSGPSSAPMNFLSWVPPVIRPRLPRPRTRLDAYRRIAAAKARFFSRGDNSGTHKKEMDIWKKAGLQPQGDWYVVTKDFMTATLKRANQEKGYFMVDSSTWVAEKKNMPNLKILFKGDKLLVNTYHALCQPPGPPPGPPPRPNSSILWPRPRGSNSSGITAGIATARACTTMRPTPGSTLMSSCS